MSQRTLIKSIINICIIFVLIITFEPNNPMSAHASIISNTNQDNVLLNKVAKDYTKKFCNGIGFGLSENSAMTFALKENKQAFSKRKGIEIINKDDLANKISTYVVEKCGYPIGRNGPEGIASFKSFYVENETKTSLE